ncbi:uncharacterized protein MEPE_04072 [Melanopsichium pennsylvanicum]|uniref:ER membrane protein complex subunit 7 beta-sandwich domain-containing protein n=2 Tax=Melanopsichium pennsylvanicum TaxID=63383 RepID=A0AAJ5C6A6_9BASI|nr:conserved hypothetical protein [Melanopsichium pennsylvanicum 4]SNX85363.1 uncharacterized protein MEPE_04072 [Melanopsichium pennsylvanicum]
MTGQRCLRTVILVALATLISTVWAGQDFRGQIQSNAELGHLVNLGPNTRVLVNAIPPQPATVIPGAAQNQAPITAIDDFGAVSNHSIDLAAFGQQHDRSTLVAVDGSFIFRDLEQGAYTLQVVSRTHTFEKYRIDILDPQLGKAPQIRIFTPGTSLLSILSNNLVFHPLILHAVKQIDYYTEAAPLTISSLIGMGGPMLILGLVAMGMVFIMPKLTASLDSESQKELADSQARMQKRLTAVQSGDVASLFYSEDHIKKGQEKEKAANKARAQRNTGSSK